MLSDDKEEQNKLSFPVLESIKKFWSLTHVAHCYAIIALIASAN
jgi:hypothetical protein